ncbi:MAG: hypothetical protein FVQ82_14845 [Planctomycetes bacterium]|nr:hypothetical protein [Planctomycetota bacterium]
MNYSSRNKSIFSILVLLTIFGVCTESFGFGTGVGAVDYMQAREELNGGRSRSGNRRSAAAGTGNAQVDVVTVLNDAYTKLAATLNAHRVPAKQQIASNVAALRTLKTVFSRMRKKLPAKYYMLMAWNEYFSGDLTRAQQAAQIAYKTSAVEDARVTMTSITLLAGERPVRVPKKKTPPKNPNTYSGYNTTSQAANLLDFDVESLNTQLTDPKSPKISAMELNCVNSTTFKYTPGSEALCVIFWQLSDKDAASVTPSEPNDPSATGAVPATASTPTPGKTSPQYYDGFEGEYAMQPHMNPYGSSAAQKQKSTFLTNTKAFKKLFSAAFGTDNVKFLAVNTDSLVAKRKVVEKIMENPWPWAHVMAHDPKSRDTQFKEILAKKEVLVKHDKPLLVITSNDGTIKYAGSAVGFLAPMMFSKVTGGVINSTAATGTATRPSKGQTGIANAIWKMINKNKAGNNKAATTKRVDPQPKKMNPSDEYAASKLLENAKAFIKMGRRITTPKRGIEMCREIIAKYPNTKYSEGARMLLRDVPERFRKKYRITNEEMGL